MYPDFVHRFIIIKPKEVHAAMPDLKACTKIILESIEAMNDKWRIGHTKVFFRAGAVGDDVFIFSDLFKRHWINFSVICFSSTLQ